MKKRILGVVIALVLCLGLLPTTALADGGPLGLSKGDTVYGRYDSLEQILEAISASADNYTIKLLDNYTETSSGSPYQIDHICTLDLNGHALKLTNGFQLVNGGTLTLTDSSADAKGSFTVTGGQPCFTVDDSGSELNINSGICQSDAAVITANSGTVRVTGGTLAGGRGAGSAAPRTIYSYGNTGITLGGSAVITNDCDACVALYGGNLKIQDNASLTGCGGVYLFNSSKDNSTDGNVHSSLTMTGGSVEATAAGDFALTGNNLMSAGCSADITGGSLTAGDTSTAIYWPMEGTLTIGGTASVTGGTGIEAKMGTITIEDSATVTGTGTYDDDFAPVNGDSVTEGSALLFSTQMYGGSASQYSTSPNLTVHLNGGTLKSTNGNAVTIYNTDNTQSQTAEIYCEDGVTLSGGAQDTGGLFRFLAPAYNELNFSLTPSQYGGAVSDKTSLHYGSGMAAAVCTNGHGAQYRECAIYPSVAEALEAAGKAADGNVIIKVCPSFGYEGGVIELPAKLSNYVGLYVPENLKNLTIHPSGGDVLVKATNSSGTEYSVAPENIKPQVGAPTVAVTQSGGSYVLSASLNLPQGATLDSFFCRWYKDGVCVDPQNTEFTSSTKFTPTEPGTYTVEVWASFNWRYWTYLTPVASKAAPALGTGSTQATQTKQNPKTGV